jgi:hypothetical protein
VAAARKLSQERFDKIIEISCGFAKATGTPDNGESSFMSIDVDETRAALVDNMSDEDENCTFYIIFVTLY